MLFWKIVKINSVNFAADIDFDTKLSRNDLSTVLSMITDDTLRQEEKEEIVDKVNID